MKTYPTLPPGQSKSHPYFFSILAFPFKLLALSISFTHILTPIQLECSRQNVWIWICVLANCWQFVKFEFWPNMQEREGEPCMRTAGWISCESRFYTNSMSQQMTTSLVNWEFFFIQTLCYSANVECYMMYYVSRCHLDNKLILCFCFQLLPPPLASQTLFSDFFDIICFIFLIEQNEEEEKKHTHKLTQKSNNFYNCYDV